MLFARLKKNAATKIISTRVMNGVASPSRNQAIIRGGKEIEMSLIVVCSQPSLLSSPCLRCHPYRVLRNRTRSGDGYPAVPIQLCIDRRPRSEGVRFVPDSPLEGGGFELLVPRNFGCPSLPEFTFRNIARHPSRQGPMVRIYLPLGAHHTGALSRSATIGKQVRT